MLKIKRNRILHLLPEKDIMETLKDFVITEDNHMNNTSVFNNDSIYDILNATVDEI